MLPRVSRATARPVPAGFPAVLVPLPQQMAQSTIQPEEVHSAEELLSHPLVRKYGLDCILSTLPEMNDRERPERQSDSSLPMDCVAR
jgi:hypothetical protein